LDEDNLQDPDLFLANAGEWKALVALSCLAPTAVRPALMVGTPEIELPHPRIPRPIDWPQLFKAMDALIEKRADTLSRLEASDVVMVPERRRRDRVDVDLTDPVEYLRMRWIPEQAFDGQLPDVDFQEISSAAKVRALTCSTSALHVPIHQSSMETCGCS
jgi:hypothetical protein